MTVNYLLFVTDIALAQPSKETSSDVTDTKTSSSATAMPDTSHSTMLPEKGTDIKHDSTSKCEATVSMMHNICTAKKV